MLGLPTNNGDLQTKFMKGYPTIVLRVETIYLDLPENERICSDCRTPLEKIGTEFVRRELHYVPAKVKVLEYYSVNYGCPSCRERALVPHIVKGKDGRAHMLHGMASASTVAWDHLPEVFQWDAAVSSGAGL